MSCEILFSCSFFCFGFGQERCRFDDEAVVGSFAYEAGFVVSFDFEGEFFTVLFDQGSFGGDGQANRCLLYTSDAADEL